MKKIVYLLLISFILLVPITSSFSELQNLVLQKKAVEETNPIIVYNAVISIECNDFLNHSLIPGGPATTIHFTIGYSVVVPSWLLRPPFKILKHIFLFGTPVYFPQIITLLIENTPTWANIYFTTPDIYIDNISNTPHYATAALIIYIYPEAPAGLHSILLKATAPQLYRIQDTTSSATLSFLVQWMPYIIVTTNQTTIITPPNTITNLSINVTNEGNGEAIINVTTPNIEGWSINSDPQQFVIAVGATKQVVLHILSPEQFQGTHSIELLFTPSHNGETGTPILLVITVQYP